MMEILIISMFSTDEEYDYIYRTRFNKHVDPAQKFFRNLVYGLSINGNNISVTCISVPQVSHSTHPKVFWERKENIQDTIHFITPEFRNGRITRFLDQNRGVKDETKRWLEMTNGKKRAIICDPLLWHATECVTDLAHEYTCPVVALVTDLPLQWMKMGKVRNNIVSYSINYAYNYLSERALNNYDGYIWLTKQMNQLKNALGRPYTIVEGFCDVHKEKNKKNIDIDMVFPDRFAMYAGGIHKVFKLKQLAEAFVKADIPNTTLLFFGDGDEVDEIIKYSIEHKQIKYMGVVNSDSIAYAEEKAILLINPRPSSDEYTKYSFPSKTLEYMGSGTAVLSTRLPGIPNEYNDYLYWFDKETSDEMKTVLKNILDTDDNTLRLFGQRAKEFVEANKSAQKQALKIIELIEKL